MCRTRVHKAWISLLVLGSVVALSGCATSQEELLPTKPGMTMASVWHRAMGGSMGGASAGGTGGTTMLQQARRTLRRSLPGTPNPTVIRAHYTRTAVNEIHSQFHRLPNPDLTLYVFPHLSGGAGEQVPIPGYTTIFPLYTRPHYGQPGERVVYQVAPDNNSGVSP